MRHDRAHIGDLFGLYPQQRELRSVRRQGLERHMREPQKTCRVVRRSKAIDESQFDKINVRRAGLLLHGRWLIQMRRLPLRRLLLRICVVMAGTVVRVIVMIMMCVIMIFMIVVVGMSTMHGAPQ